MNTRCASTGLTILHLAATKEEIFGAKVKHIYYSFKYSLTYFAHQAALTSKFYLWLFTISLSSLVLMVYESKLENFSVSKKSEKPVQMCFDRDLRYPLVL